MSESNVIKVVLVRHGESTWNKENRFTGWTDVPLSEKGLEEAKFAGDTLKKDGFIFDIAYTSVLKRAIKTLNIVLDQLDQSWIPVVKDYRLNERHYGSLQGLNKSETASKHGEEQVLIWRRSYDIPPPALEKNDPRNPSHDPRYANVPVPLTECLKDTVERFLPFWNDVVVPTLKQGKRVIIAAHGNTIRALVKYLDNVSESEITELNIPTGIPLVYELDKTTMKPIKHYYLADEETVKNAISSVANQGKKQQ